MSKAKEPVTIFAIGDRIDFDSYKKFHKQRNFVVKQGFNYASADYKHLLKGQIPKIETKKIIIFLFFPFVYWNRFIECKNYKGVYGNKIFYEKFVHFWDEINKIIKEYFHDKEIFFINKPFLCGLYRDKLLVKEKFSKSKIPNPKLYKISGINNAKKVLNKGLSLFMKPRYGSMGKGMTFLSWSHWTTNFIFKHNRITGRRADHGWKFRDVTGNNRFLMQLLKKDIIIEKSIESLTVKKMRLDLRMYTFFNKVIYVYPRKNDVDKITTNISQGGRGDPSLLRILPKVLMKRAKKAVESASKALGFNLAGLDVMLDRNLKDIYVIDVNLFPGFPKRRTHNLAQYMIKELVKLSKKGKLRFEKGCNI